MKRYDNRTTKPRQSSTTTPAPIARINTRLIEGRICTDEAAELLEPYANDWNAIAGQFDDRRVFVGSEFVIQNELRQTRPAKGYIGKLSVERVVIAKIMPDARVSGIRYAGGMVLASLYDDVQREQCSAQVAVSLPREFSYSNEDVTRTVFYDISQIGRPQQD